MIGTICRVLRDIAYLRERLDISQIERVGLSRRLDHSFDGAQSISLDRDGQGWAALFVSAQLKSGR
jgi:hypothetical protein